MRPKDRPLARQLERKLKKFSRDVRGLPGIDDPAMRSVFLEQLIDSVHRISFIRTVSARPIGPFRSDPQDARFDPFLAAISAAQRGAFEEACWLVFLGVHFGKNSKGGWRYAREVYAGSGGDRWDWNRVSADPASFQAWLVEHAEHIGRKSPPGGFGNHRKYLSLDAYYPAGTGAAVASYVRWIQRAGGHRSLIDSAVAAAAGDPRNAFALLYRSMKEVASFGRMGRFDYLTMLGKMGLAPIEPGSTYLETAIGPMNGARLLFKGKKTARVSRGDLENWVSDLEAVLGVGMQVMEDALCNWQKSPNLYTPFRG